MHTSNLDSDSESFMFKFKLPRQPVTASGIMIIIAFCRSACRALALPSRWIDSRPGAERLWALRTTASGNATVLGGLFVRFASSVPVVLRCARRDHHRDHQCLSVHT